MILTPKEIELLETLRDSGVFEIECDKAIINVTYNIVQNAVEEVKVETIVVY